MRGGSRQALFLIVALLGSSPAHASTCLKETAPEVAPYLASGEPARMREAIAAIADRADQPEAGLAAPWLAAQASMLLDLGAINEAEQRLRRAISGWMRQGDVAAEVCARHLLVFALMLRSEPRSALAETLLAETRARDADLGAALNRLKQTRVTLLLTLNERLEEALVLMGETRPGDTPAEQLNWHHVRGLMLGRLKRHRRAAADFERVLELARAESLDAMVATARLNLASQWTHLGREDPFAIPEQRIVELLDLVVSDPHSRPATRAMAWRLLARFRPPGERQALLAECMQASEQAGDDRRRAVCLADLAELQVENDPARALEHIAEAVALAEAEPRALWQIQAQRLAVIWATEEPRSAFESSLQAIDGEKRLRELQMTGPERARLIDGLSWDYRRLADYGYRHAGTDPELANRGFDLLEANRALVLREQRHARHETDGESGVRELAERINRTQQALLSPATTGQRRQRLRQELEWLELAWHEANVQPPDRAPDPPQSPELATIREALRRDEAVLSFLTLVPGYSSGEDGWLQVITRQDSRLYRVPGHHELAHAADLLRGFSDWQHAAARRLRKRLAERLLHPALGDLAPGIRHLLVIPDRGIDRLPLEILPGADGIPVGIGYSMDIAPSAGVWLDARRTRPGPGRVLALADPALAEVGYRALDTAYPGGRQDDLPGAVMEARQIRRLSGHGMVRLRSGPEASEGILHQPLATAGIRMIHFATHTLIHPEQFDRSAVLLAADAHGDGLLQPREIERLDLAGAAVVLASCASATGQRLDNEGIISLARSFMAAGAASVIATRWPVDDRHAQAFFTRFYRHLAEGREQSGAMRRARADLRASGYPEHAWAAYVLHGDGRWQPVPARAGWPAWTGLLLALALTGLLTRRVLRAEGKRI